jgi:hypothetical protein
VGAGIQFQRCGYWFPTSALWVLVSNFSPVGAGIQFLSYPTSYICDDRRPTGGGGGPLSAHDGGGAQSVIG